MTSLKGNGAPLQRPRTVAIVSRILPYPPDSGKSAVLRGFVRYFVDQVGADHVHYIVVEAPQTKPPELLCHLHVVPRPGTTRQLWSGIDAVVTKRRSLQEAFVDSPALRRELWRTLRMVAPELTIWDTVRLGQHRPGVELPGRHVMYLDDLFSVRYERMLAAGDSGGLKGADPLGAYASTVPQSLGGLVRRPAIYRPLLNVEKRLVARRENELVHQFDMSLLISDEEVDLLKARSGYGQIQVIPPLLPAVDTPLRQPVTPPSFVFLGRLDVPHNAESIARLINSEGRNISSVLPDAELHVVGKGATSYLQRLAGQHPDLVRLTGWVPDLEGIFSQSTAMVAPIVFGTGIKLKVLDALARGLPVIGTSSAFSGIAIGTVGSSGCLVEDDISRWPRLMAYISEPEVNARLSAAALRFYHRMYGTDAVMKRYDELFAGVGAAEEGSA